MLMSAGRGGGWIMAMRQQQSKPGWGGGEGRVERTGVEWNEVEWRKG